MNDVKDLMTQAIGALKAGRKEEAYRLFSEVADLDRTNEDALLGKAGLAVKGDGNGGRVGRCSRPVPGRKQ